MKRLDEYLTTKYPELISFIKEDVPWVVQSIIEVVAIIVTITITNPTNKIAWFLVGCLFLVLAFGIILRLRVFKFNQTGLIPTCPASNPTKISHKRNIINMLSLLQIVMAACVVYFSINNNEGPPPPPPPPPEITSPTIITESSEFDILGWEEIINSEPGDTIYFGKYRQSEWTDDKENISWTVLAKESDRLLILTTKCIDCKQFHDLDETCTWETSSIRRWLNNDFLEEAFNGPEKSKILTVNVPADGNPHYDTVFLGDDTEDKIFLLSIIEAEKYLGSNEKLKAFPTEYAKSVGSGFDHDLAGNPCWWWLRTPGQNNSCIADIRSGGAINYEGYPATSTTFSVRPALWLDINS